MGCRALFTTPNDLGTEIDFCCELVAQSFTAGLSGPLGAVSVNVSGNSLGFPLRIAIRDASAAAPGASELAAKVLSGESADLDQLIVFANLVTVTAGQQYAIVASYVGVQLGMHPGTWHGAVGNVYASGAEYLFFDGGWVIQPNFDLHFKTYIGTPVPEPSTVALLGMGLTGCAGVSLRRRRRRVEGRAPA